jgi:hypothetical protein
MYNNNRVNYTELNFDHIVEFTQDSTVFAAGRENGSGHMRLFLINESTGHVYTRNGRADSWEQLNGSDRDTILARLSVARHNHIPVYKINGTNGTHTA